MAYSKCDSEKHVSYMDGIPVKISEKYKPPKKIILPGAVVNKLNVEVSLPEYDFTLERSVLEKLSQWRQLRQSQREARKQRMETEKKLRAASAREETPSAEPSSPPSILTPVPIHASTHPHSTIHHSSINVSEFEQDTSSPFDNMELKTINDLEELAHVLQPVVINEKVEKKDPPPPRLNGFNQNSYDSWTNCNAAGPGWYRAPVNTVQSYVVQRMDSRSVPDILKELRMELRDKREAEQRTEQPQRPASTGPAEIMLQSQTSNLTSRKSGPVAEVPSITPASTLPNPYAQLSSACQLLCDRLAEMGFPLARVARAAQLLGDDETRVVEFLVQVQRLEELSFLGDRAEQALIANDHKEAETLEYLRTQTQLLGFGFSEDQVTKALKECGTDRDKALDWLIS